MSETNYWTRLRRQQISRRRLLRSAALGGVGAAGLALVGCGDDDDEEEVVAEAPAPAPAAPAAEPATEPAEEEEEEAAPAPAPAPAAVAEMLVNPHPDPNATPPSAVTRGGTFLTIANRVGSALNDPHFDGIGYWGGAGEELFENLAGTGFEKGTDILRGQLLTSMEFPDPLTVLGHVRDGVNFHDKPPIDGRKMEARDIVYSLNSARGTLFPEEGAPRRGGFFRVLDIAAVDSLTVRVDFEAPSSVFVQAVFGEQRMQVLPEGLREAFGGSDSLHPARPERHIGTGAFIPIQYEPSEIHVRNPNYWNQPLPYIDRLESIEADRSTQIAGMLSRQNHTMNRVSEEEKTILAGSPDIKFYKHNPGGFYHFGWNTRRPGLSDPRMRQALTLVYNQPGISAAVIGNEEDWRYAGPLPFSYPEAIPQAELATRKYFRSPTDADLAEAKQLADAAGFGSGGLKVSIRTPDLRGTLGVPSLAEHLSAQVEQYLPGNEIQVDLQSYTEMLAGIQALDFDGYWGGWALEADGVIMMQTVYQTDGPRAFTGYSSPQMDQLFQDALAEVESADRRADIMRDMQNLGLEDMPALVTSNNITADAERAEVRDMLYGFWIVNRVFRRYCWLSA